MPLPINAVNQHQLKHLWEQTTIPLIAPIPRAAIDAPADDERPRPEPIWIRDNAQAQAWAA